MILRKFILLCFLAVFSMGLFAQSEKNSAKYLLDIDRVKLTGFGNTNSQLSLIDSKLAHFSGLSGAFLLNYQYYIGAYSYSLNTVHKWNDIYPSNYHPVDNPSDPLYVNSKLCFNHGGLMLGYIHNHTSIWHPTFDVKIGGGRIALVDENFSISDFDEHHADWVGVLTPEVGIEVNVTRWFKARISAGYSYVFSVDKTYYTDMDGNVNRLFSEKQFSSPFAALSFHFGSFGPRNNDE
jgi:hypothetical protein